MITYCTALSEAEALPELRFTHWRPNATVARILRETKENEQ